MHAYSGTVTTVLYPLSDRPSGRVMRPSSSGGARAVRPGAVEPLRPELPVAAPAHVVHLVVREAAGMFTWWMFLATKIYVVQVPYSRRSCIFASDRQEDRYFHHFPARIIG